MLARRHALKARFVQLFLIEAHGLLALEDRLGNGDMIAIETVVETGTGRHVRKRRKIDSPQALR